MIGTHHNCLFSQLTGSQMNGPPADDCIGPITNAYAKEGDPRGPQARTLRQKASQYERSAKKQKVRGDVAVCQASAFSNVSGVIGGAGLQTGAYVAGRHGVSIRGTSVATTPRKVVNKIHGGPNNVKRMEGVVTHQDVLPKYIVSEDNTPGTKKSKAACPIFSAKVGLKSQFPNAIAKPSGIQMANQGVTLLNVVEAELSQQFGRPATPDETKAAMLLSILNAPANRNLQESERIPVSNDYSRP